MRGTSGGGGVLRTATQRSARIAPARSRVMPPLRASCNSVGPSKRDIRMPKRSPTITTPYTFGPGAPAPKIASVFCASCQLNRRETPALNSFTTWPGAQAWTSEEAPSPIFSPKDPDIAHPPLGVKQTLGVEQRQTY